MALNDNPFHKSMDILFARLEAATKRKVEAEAMLHVYALIDSPLSEMEDAIAKANAQLATAAATCEGIQRQIAKLQEIAR